MVAHAYNPHIREADHQACLVHIVSSGDSLGFKTVSQTHTHKKKILGGFCNDQVWSRLKTCFGGWRDGSMDKYLLYECEYLGLDGSISSLSTARREVDTGEPHDGKDSSGQWKQETLPQTLPSKAVL